MPLRMNSLEGLRKVAEAGLEPDFIYVDAQHTYEAVTAELKLCRELFPHSLVGGDDYDWQGVCQAAEEFAGRRTAWWWTDWAVGAGGFSKVGEQAKPVSRLPAVPSWR